MNEIPFPTHIDSSMLGAFKSCERKFFYNYMMHLQPTARSVHLIAGGAYAKGLEVTRLCYFWEKMKPLDCLHHGGLALMEAYGDFNCPEDSPKTLPNMLLALHEYFDHYGWGEDLLQPFTDRTGKPAIEFTFALPIGINHPVSGEPILYVGRYDLLGLYHNALYVVDEKTTSRLGPSWRKQWNLRSQFSGYCWAAKQYGYPVVGAIVRGISILSKDFGHEEVISLRPDFMIQDWHTTTQYYIRRMIESWESSNFHLNLDGACNEYGGCRYALLCDKREPLKWVDTNYKVIPWNPIGAVI